MTIRQKRWIVLVIIFGFFAGVAYAIIAHFGDQRGGEEEGLIVSPQGAGQNCSISDPCSLMEARDQVRTVIKQSKQDIYVYLRGGTYELDSPFQLTAEDSGTSAARVIYQPYRNESVTISGGRKVTGWQLYDRGKNIYVAAVDPKLQSRQLFVNGTRAVRARSEDHPAGFVKNAQGYLNVSVQYADMGAWKQYTDLEFVGMTNWKNYRCGVQQIHGNEIILDSLCWTKTQQWETMNEPVWFENAYELLDQEGEWYGDWQRGKIYYKPRPGENIRDSETILPVLDSLVLGTGIPEQLISHITFRNISFAYGTWHAPSSTVGYTPIQAGVVFIDPLDREKASITPSQLQFQWATDIVLERNRFMHMGSSGVAFDRGSQNNRIVGNRFEDLSGHAIQIGNVTDNWATGANVVKGNIINNNYILLVGQEYYDAIGIFVGYAAGTIIDHNEIEKVPYTGISVGWGWTDKAFESLANNRITNNLIHDYMLTLNDGGGIYTLSRQDNSEISGNYLYNNHHDYGSIYLDLGSYGFNVSSNVISDRVANWIFVQDTVAPYSYKNTIIDNFTDTNKIRVYKENVVSNNLVFMSGQWTVSAQKIMRNAGLEPAFQNMKRDSYTK